MSFKESFGQATKEMFARKEPNKQMGSEEPKPDKEIQQQFIQSIEGNSPSSSGKEDFLAKVASGAITSKEFSFLVNNIPTPINLEKNPASPVETFRKIQDNRDEMWVLASLVGKEVTTLSAVDLYNAHFRYANSLHELDINERRILDISQKKGASPEILARETKAFTNFRRHTFGDRQRYWEQAQLLMQEAKRQEPARLEENPELRALNKKESGAVLAVMEIHGEPFHRRSLFKEDIIKEGMEPKYMVAVEGANVYFSDPYEIGQGRIAVVGYVHKGNEVVARSFYRSNSTGLWRYLPKYREEPGPKKPTYYKGYGEESITLPISLQKPLARLSERPKKIVSDPEFIFKGTARVVENQTDGTYRHEIYSIPTRVKGNFYSERGRKVNPEKMSFEDSNDEPNFERRIDTWTQRTNLYGDIRIETFSSRNGRYTYMMCQDSQKRVWVGGVEVAGQIGTTGLKPEWVDVDCLATPAYEYESQSDSWGNQALRKNPYIDMYANYISKIPLIRKYVQRSRK